MWAHFAHIAHIVRPHSQALFWRSVAVIDELKSKAATARILEGDRDHPQPAAVVWCRGARDLQPAQNISSFPHRRGGLPHFRHRGSVLKRDPGYPRAGVESYARHIVESFLGLR